jgi:hypothetical protein
MGTRRKIGRSDDDHVRTLVWLTAPIRSRQGGDLIASRPAHDAATRKRPRDAERAGVSPSKPYAWWGEVAKHLAASPFGMMPDRRWTARECVTETVGIISPDEQDPRGQDEQCEKDRHEELPAWSESLFAAPGRCGIARVTGRFAAGSPEFCLVARWSSRPLLGCCRFLVRIRMIRLPRQPNHWA